MSDKPVITWGTKFPAELLDALEEAVVDLMMLETLYRTDGSPVEADRLRSVRKKLAAALEQVKS